LFESTKYSTPVTVSTPLMALVSVNVSVAASYATTSALHAASK